MDYKEMFQVKDDAELVEKLYGIFDEDTRLNRSKAARVEFITNTRIIEQYIKPGDRILDIGAGAGADYLFSVLTGLWPERNRPQAQCHGAKDTGADSSRKMRQRISTVAQDS